MGRPLDVAYRARLRGLAALPALVLLVYGATPAWTSGFREDEVHCEEAKAHLLDCCDNFSGTLECKFIDHGCGTTYPDLDVSEARAIQDQSCDEIQSNGNCSKNFTEPE